MTEYMSPKEILKKYEEYLLPAVMKYHKEPIHVVKGEMQYVYDHTGKKYLDAFGAVVTISVGHCHPDVVSVVQKQIEILQHITTLYLTEPVVKLAEKFAQITPGELCKSFFTNSGTEANEVAALLCKNYTKRHEFIGLRHSFHGRTLMSMTLTGQSIWRHSVPYVFGVSHAPSGYCYRCPYGLTYPNCDIKCAYEIEEIIKYSTSGTIAGFIAEPIQGFGGVIDPPKEYFKIAVDIVHKYGGLFISDEVQTGMGRTGDKWFGIEQWDVIPDLITVAKGFGNGVPIGGVITTAKIAESMRGVTHFSTYGGNPVSCVQAKAVIDTIEKHNYAHNSTVVGNYIKEQLLNLQEKHSIIGDVRGKGLMLGVELVRDRKTKEPANTELLQVMDLCKEQGVLIGKGGMSGNVIRIKPPMCITKDDADILVNALDTSFQQLQ